MKRVRITKRVVPRARHHFVRIELVDVVAEAALVSKAIPTGMTFAEAMARHPAIKQPEAHPDVVTAAGIESMEERQ